MSQFASTNTLPRDFRADRITRRAFLKATAGTATILAAGCDSQDQEAPSVQSSGGAASASLYAIPSPDALSHLLKRTTFGVSRADREHAQALGAEKWLEEQLAPASIPDPTDALVASRLPVTQVSRADGPDGVFMKAGTGSATVIYNQIVEAAILRACYSPRQVYELMVEFWSNHFNVDGRELFIFLKLFDDREVIRPHALGRFSDLLHASAKSPAMLTYLDNDTNTRTGPNENYARELLELHTLGASGGYTEEDVREVARCFTGWTWDYNAIAFLFKPENHDDGAKTVLGQPITGGGQRDGEQVLDLLARHPSTARFIVTKLCRRFVTDIPPGSLVGRVAQVFTATDGDVPSMLRTILTAPEFYAAAGAKLGRPMEYVAACIRAIAPDPAQYFADITPSQALDALGQRPFEWAPPNGYSDSAAFWSSTTGLVERWRFATSLAKTRINGHSHGLDLAGAAATPAAIVDVLSATLLLGPLRRDHRDALVELVAGSGDPNRTLSPAERQDGAEAVAGLLLSSPYFLVR